MPKTKAKTPPLVPLSFDPAKLAARRNAIGKSQVQIAEHVGIAQSNYARIEQGRHTNVRLDAAVRIARALRCLVEDLLVE